MESATTQPTLLPPEAVTTPEVTVKIILSAFRNRDAVQRAVRSLASKDAHAASAVTRAWSRVMMEALQTGVEGQQYINKASLIVKLDAVVFNTAGFAALVSEGMLVVITEKVTTEVGDADFERFWNEYPKRNNQRVGKADARTEFNRYITSRAQYDLLIVARNRYASMCGGFPKDAARFIKQNRWMEYLPSNPDTAHGTPLASTNAVRTSPSALSGSQLREMLK